MRDYEKLVEKLTDHAIYELLSKGRKRYTVTVDDIHKVLPCERAKPMGFGV